MLWQKIKCMWMVMMSKVIILDHPIKLKSDSVTIFLQKK